MADVTNPATDVKVGDLPAYLATVESADEVRAMKAADDRSTAQQVYDARIAEIEGDSAEPATEAKPAAKPAGKAPRKARTRVKYQGTWYAPGDTVPFASKADAEPYDEARALEPAK